jgi:beta-lactamase regulating signal transducer with metallopeptidase domain
VDAVLNWLWQGGVVALAAWAALRMMDASRAQARHSVVWVALLSVLVLPLVPFIWTAVAAARDSGDMPDRAGLVVSVPAGWWTSSRVVLGAWTLWSGVYAARVAAAMLALGRAKRRSVPPPPQLEKRLSYWTGAGVRGRQTRIVVSDRVRYAAVLGGRSPVIAVSPAVLQHLTDEELDRVLIHEWAHVQRRDDLGQLVQLLVRVIAGWHPAIWWLDRQLHIEREVACDETAVAMTGSAKLYAACLAKLASLPPVRLRTLPAVAAWSSPGLRRRIVRILSDRRYTAPARSWTIEALGAGLSLFVVAMAVGGWRLIERAAVPADVVALKDGAVSGSATVDRPSPSLFSNERTAAPTQPTRTRARRTTGRQAYPPAAAGSAVVLSMVVAIADPATPQVVELPIPIVPSRSTVAVSSSASSTAPDPAVVLTAGADAAPAVRETKSSPWAAAADNGVAFGRRSQKAATATAGFFTRFGKRIADTF